MKSYSTSELRRLEIVNSCDGSKLGSASDFEFEAEGECTRITALIIKGRSGIFGFGCEEDIRIPWCDIQCIGEDIILVRGTSVSRSCGCRPKKRFGR